MVADAIKGDIIFEVNQSMNSIFGTSNTLNLNFVDANLNDPSTDGITNVDAGGGRGATSIDITITLNTGALQNASREFIAATIIHETFHGYLNYLNSSFQHQVMISQYIESFTAALHKMYPSVSSDDLLALSYGGLQGTHDFLSLPIGDQNRYLNLNTNYKNGTDGTPCTP
jgi:hypothetical protein